METIKLATYNIHRAVGSDGCRSPERILSVLAEIDADIVALQELELHRDPALNMLDYLAHNTGLTPVGGPTIIKADARYGNALLSRLKIAQTRRIDLTLPGREPRGAIDADLAWGESSIHLVTTHLGLRPRERRRQVRALLTLFDRDQADMTVLMGDINEWFLWGRPLRWLHRRFPLSLARRTFPARWPLFALDRIWVDPQKSVLRLDIHDSDHARRASDHLPLTAVISRPWGPDNLVHTARSDESESRHAMVLNQR